MKWFLVAAVFGLVACDDGGDDSGGGGGGGFNSGVDESKQVSELTDEEANQICRAAEEYGDSLISKSQACTFASLLFSEDEASCNQFKAACEDAPEEEDEEDDCTEGLPPELEGCTATVAEMEACQEAVAGQVRSVIAGLSCADAGNAENLGSALNVDPESLPSCQVVKEKCPNAFESSNDGM